MGDIIVAANARKATNLTLDSALLEEARALRLNVSRAAEVGIAEAVKAEKSRLWQRDNAEAIEGANAWLETNGLPLKKYRLF
jgi:antitoxin CcdA